MDDAHAVNVREPTEHVLETVSNVSVRSLNNVYEGNGHEGKHQHQVGHIVKMLQKLNDMGRLCLDEETQLSLRIMRSLKDRRRDDLEGHSSGCVSDVHGRRVSFSPPCTSVAPDDLYISAAV
jgi:hypothetical protein